MIKRIIFTMLCAAPVLAAAEAVEFSCNFTSYTEPDQGPRSTSFVFDIVWDTVSNDAFIKGNGGVSPLSVYIGAEAVTFLEGLPSGTIQLTVILADGQAAHSRHTIIAANEIVPSQYYGTCEQDSSGQ